MLSDIKRPVGASVVKSIWQSILAGGTTPPVILPVIEYLVVVGSSTTQETFGLNTVLGRQEHNARASFTAAGIDVPIINKAVGGATIAALDNNINTYLTELGNPSKVCGVLINIGSNDIGATSYAAMSQPTKDAMVVGLNSIIDKIVAAGHIPILGTVNSREGYAEMYEVWATEMYRPLVQARTPDWFANPLADFDYCRLYLTNKDVPDWWQPDGVHPEGATIPMQQYTAAQLLANADVPEVGTTERYIFCFPPSTRNVGGINCINAAASGTSSTLFNSNGVSAPGKAFSWTGATGSSGSVRGNAGNFDVGLENNTIQTSLVFRSGGTFTMTFNCGIGYAGRTGTIKFTMNSSATPRITRYTLPDATSVVINGSSGIQIASLPFTMDGAGTLTFSCTPEAPSTFASISGVEFEFD